MFATDKKCPEGLKLLITESELQEKVLELSRQILQDHQPCQQLVLIGVLKGAFVFLSDLVRALSPFPVTIDFVQTSSYGMNTKSTGNVQIVRDIQIDIHQKAVILVEDIMDSGYTVAHLKKIMYARRASSVKICSMLDKPSRREVDLQADYIGFTVPNRFVVGYGMDALENYRNLPFVAYLEEASDHIKGESS